MKVAICLCTYRRQDLLRGLLRHLRDTCDLPPGTELIVADNECSAETARIVAREYPQATYVTVSQIGLSEARNVAADTALLLGAQALAFIDDDDLPAPDWLQELIATQAATEAPIVFGAMQKRNEKKRRNSRATCNCLVMRWAVKSIAAPYFDPRLNYIGGEDALFFERIEAASTRESAATMKSVVLKSLQDDRYTPVALLVRGFSQGYRVVFISKYIYPLKGRSALHWCCYKWLKFFRSLLLVPVRFWKVRSYRKAWESFGSALGGLFALLGGKYEHYRQHQPARESVPVEAQ